MRLIYAEDCKDRMYVMCAGQDKAFVRAMEQVIADGPTADAAPVVRCKDCKHYELDACLKIYQDGNVSNDAWQERKPTDFCSYGERKENGI
jgi:hypothetical protein